MPEVKLPYTPEGEEMAEKMQDKVDTTFGDVPTYEGGGRTQPGNMTDFDNVGVEVPQYQTGGPLKYTGNPMSGNPMASFGGLGAEPEPGLDRSKYAQGAEGDKAMLVDSLVSQRANLKKGSAQHRDVQNKINRLLGVDVKHSAKTDRKKKRIAQGKEYKPSDLDRVKMYKEKNWAMDHTINEAALQAYEEGNV